MCNGDHLSRKIGFLRKPYFYFLESVCVCVHLCGQSEAGAFVNAPIGGILYMEF